MCQNCNKESILKQAINIAVGIKNIISNNPEIESMAAPRLSICSKCSKRIELVKIGNNIVYKCGLCNCLIEAKTRVENERCPDNKW